MRKLATVENALQLIGTTALSTKPIVEVIEKTEAMRNEFKRPFKMDSFINAGKAIFKMAGEFYSVQNAVKDSANSINKSVETIAKSLEESQKISLKDVVGKVKGFAEKAKEGMAMVDKYSNQNARLSMMTDKRQSAGELQQKVYSAAQNSRSSYDGTVSTVTKLGLSAKGKVFRNNDEIVGFTELMNKSFAGTDPGEASKSMDKITDAMVSGKLKGEDMSSVFQNAPALGQAVSKYTGQSQQQLIAGDGISADVLKNSMFSAANDINSKFAAMPVTFQQIGTSLQNTLLQAFGPVMAAIANGAQWIYQNWSGIAPIFWGIAAAVGAYAIGMGIASIATAIQKVAQDGLNLSLLASPLFWVALVIGVIIGAIIKWIQSVGGIQVAWLIVVNAVLTAWDWMKIGFFTGVYWVIDLWNKMVYGMRAAGVAIQNFMGDMKVGVLMILQNMVNGAIDIINKFIGLLNKIPGVSIDTVSHLSFGTEAKAQNDAEKKAREADLAQYKSQIDSESNQHTAKLEAMKAEARANTENRMNGIAVARADAAKKKQSGQTSFNAAAYNPAKTGGIGDSDTRNNIANTAANTGAMKDSMDVSQEDLKYMRDIAEQDVINKFTTAEIKVDMTNHNNINSNLDLDGVVSYMEQKVYETLSVASEGVYS